MEISCTYGTSAKGTTDSASEMPCGALPGGTYSISDVTAPALPSLPRERKTFLRGSHATSDAPRWQDTQGTHVSGKRQHGWAILTHGDPLAKLKPVQFLLFLQQFMLSMASLRLWDQERVRWHHHLSRGTQSSQQCSCFWWAQPRILKHSDRMSSL